MSYFTYVSLAGDNKISLLVMDPRTGLIRLQKVVELSSGPGPMAVTPDNRFLYAGLRSTREIASFRINHNTGELTQIGMVTLEADPCYLATDRRGRFLLSSHYKPGIAGVHPIGQDGAVGSPPIEWRSTGEGAHSIQTDPSNRFVFIPHISVTNLIFQFEFDERTGRLKPNTIPTAIPGEGEGPRHFCFHPTKDIVYFVNEQGCSVTTYHFDRVAGTLSAFDTVSTLPIGYEGHNACADIHIPPSGRFVYASNRGHDSIACFVVDPATGRLIPIGQQPTEKGPRAFILDPEGRFVLVAGQSLGRLASYRINEQNGMLAPLEVHEIGKSPTWVLVLRLGV